MTTGRILLSKKIANHEADILAIIAATRSLADAGPNRDYYLKKRASKRTHTQAVIALARRRVDVLWAPLQDNRTWTTEPPTVTQAA